MREGGGGREKEGEKGSKKGRREGVRVGEIILTSSISGLAPLSVNISIPVKPT